MRANTKEMKALSRSGAAAPAEEAPLEEDGAEDGKVKSVVAGAASRHAKGLRRQIALNRHLPARAAAVGGRRAAKYR